MLFNSDARCKAGNYEREARLEGKAENVDAVLFERQGKRLSKKIGNVGENIASITYYIPDTRMLAWMKINLKQTTNLIFECHVLPYI